MEKFQTMGYFRGAFCKDPPILDVSGGKDELGQFRGSGKGAWTWKYLWVLGFKGLKGLGFRAKS